MLADVVKFHDVANGSAADIGCCHVGAVGTHVISVATAVDLAAVVDYDEVVEGLHAHLYGLGSAQVEVAEQAVRGAITAVGDHGVTGCFKRAQALCCEGGSGGAGV